jgi:DNA-directed RNA polymerase subunit RPC12/RpoP
MFYVKTSFGYADVITEIHDDNVFSKCPECGREVQVDLAEVFKGEEVDLYGTSVLCTECTKKRLEANRHE